MTGLAALEGDTVTQLDSTTTTWTSPSGTPIHLAAAIPIDGPTDWVNLRTPNGRASDGILIANGNRQKPDRHQIQVELTQVDLPLPPARKHSIRDHL
jgi:hypothetical protein